MKAECEYKVGDKVVYDGLVAEIESISKGTSEGRWHLNLVSVIDPEMTCSAMSFEVEPYVDGIEDDLDPESRLRDARHESNMIAMQVYGLTDKYYRDGNH